MTATDRLQAAIQALHEGRHAEALEGLAWIHHHAPAWDPTLVAVRSSALRHWGKLAQAYPAARQALDTVRDTSVHALLRGEGDRRLFLDVIHIDRIDQAPLATRDFYLALRDSQPDRAAQWAGLVLAALAAAGDHRLADQVRPDPFARARDNAVYLRQDMLWAKRRFTRAPRRWATVRNYADDVRLEAEISAAVGRHDEARRLVALAIDLVADPSLRAAIRVEIARRRPPPGFARFYHRHAKARRREARHLRRA